MVCSSSREHLAGELDTTAAYLLGELAKKIAEVLEVTLDFLVDQDSLAAVDRSTLKRMQDIQQLEQNDQQTITSVIDAFIRDAKARKAYGKN